MNFIDRLSVLVRGEARSGANPNNPSVSLANPGIFQWLFGGEPTAAGEEISHHTAMQIVTVYSCVRILAESVASLPLRLIEKTASGRLEATDNPLWDLLAVAPNAEMTAYAFWESMTGCLALTGNCYAEIIRSKGSQIDSLYPLQPLKTEPYRRPDGVLSYRTTDGSTSGSWRDIPSEAMLHIPLFSYDGLKGLSPIMQCRQALGLSRAAEKFGARFFGNGSRPGGVMSTKTMLDEKSQQNTRENWERTQSGGQQGKTAFLFGDWTYQQIGLSPEESQFLATRQFQRSEIAAIFRVPPHLVGDTTRLSNSNHEQASLQFVTDTLRPYLSRIEAEVIRKLLPTQGRNSGRYVVSFDVSERLRGDFATTMTGYSTGRTWGWYSANDVRKELGENPGGPELDVYLVPVNMQNAARLLDTESLQDQPIGGILPAPAPDPDPVPTPQERSLLAQYRTAYLRLFQDSVARVCKRDKRDYALIAQAFGPTFESIADLLAAESRALSGDATWAFDAVTTTEKHLAAMTERSAKWKTEDAGTIAAAELTRAVRAMVYAGCRAAGEHRAAVVLHSDEPSDQAA
jgi:HK97 family phage portal protein